MPFRKEIPQQTGLYFIGFTCYRWLRLLQFVDGHELVYQWFDQLRSQGHQIIGYVIMPNYINAIIDFSRSDKTINTTVGEGKRSIAYGIIERLRKNNEVTLLANLQRVVTRSDKRKGKKHEVWEESFDWKSCENPDLIYRKLQLMHADPCTGQRRLVNNAADYEHSSARYYLCGEHAGYKVMNVEEVLNSRTRIKTETTVPDIVF